MNVRVNWRKLYKGLAQRRDSVQIGGTDEKIIRKPKRKTLEKRHNDTACFLPGVGMGSGRHLYKLCPGGNDYGKFCEDPQGSKYVQ
mgnify:CR=1 FL=1